MAEALPKVHIVRCCHQPGNLDEWFTPAELVAIEHRKHPNTRRDHIAGRIAAKCALWQAAGGAGKPPRPPAIEIWNSATGKPEARISGSPQQCAARFSISHCSGEAMAVACSDERVLQIGIDFEFLRAVDRGAERFFACPEEIELVRSCMPAQPALGLWCLKEAMIKTMPGALHNPLDFSLSRSNQNPAVFEMGARRDGNASILLRWDDRRIWAVCIETESAMPYSFWQEMDQSVFTY